MRHIIPLYYIPGEVSVRTAKTLLHSLKSEKLNFKTQFAHVSKHPGA